MYCSGSTELAEVRRLIPGVFFWLVVRRLNDSLKGALLPDACVTK